MNTRRARRARHPSVANAALYGVLALAPALSSAQAWLPERGASLLSLDYSSILNKKHFTANGDEIDVGHTDTEIAAISVLYGLSDRFMVRAALPYVQTRYRGPAPHPGEVDDGQRRGTVTDLHLALHYQWMLDPVALAPYINVVIPTNSYETLGHAAPGRGLEEYWVGFYAGKSLNEWIPRAYVQGRYNYAFVEKVGGVAHDRSNADIEIGYFFNQSWSARVLAAWQESHGGVDIPVPPTNPLFPFHDQLAAEDFLQFGGGAAWSANSRVTVYALYLQALEGTNGHKVDHRVSVGMSYDLGRD